MLERPPDIDAKLTKRERRRQAQRRYRAHVRDHAKVAPVLFDALLLDYLIALHHLDAADAVDRSRVGKAISKMLTESARAWTAREPR
jgi:hypothetical protein